MKQSYIRLASALATSGASRLAALIFSFGLTAILTRYLSLEEYAFYGVVASLLVILIVITQAGYQTTIVRLAGELAADNEYKKLPPDLMGGMFVTLVISVAVCVMVYLFSTQLLPMVDGSEISNLTLIMVLLLIPIMSLNVFFAEALRGLGRVGWAASLTGLGQYGGIFRVLLLFALVVFWLAIGVFNLEILMVLSVFSSFLVAIYAFILIVRQCGFWVRWGDIIFSVKRNFILNMRLMFAQLFQMLSGQYAAIVVGGILFAGPELALFVAAQQLQILLLAPITLLNGALPRLIIEANKKADKTELANILRLGSSAAFFVSISAAIVIFLLGPWLFLKLFGNGYEGAFAFFIAITPGLLVNVFGGASGKSLALLGQERVFLAVAIASVCLALPSFYFLGNIMGPIGLAWAASITMIFQKTVFAILLYKRFGVFSHAYLNPVIYIDVVKYIISNINKKFGKKRG